MLQSGIDGSRDVRSMSFTKAMVMLGTNWLLCAARGINASLVELGQSLPLDIVVGNREGRGMQKGVTNAKRCQEPFCFFFAFARLST
jgi:hypothetical protein